MTIVIGKDIPLPHQGRARYPLGESHVVLIDLDDENVVVEVPESFLSELPGLGFIEKGTLTLAAGELRFYYFLKTPQVVELLERLRWNKR